MSSRYHCDGRRNIARKRCDCHPGNHISFPFNVPMPQPATVPVLAIKFLGSSQAPRPRGTLLLRRNRLEDRWSRTPRILYLILLLRPFPVRAVGNCSSQRTVGSSQAPRTPLFFVPHSSLCPARCLVRQMRLLDFIINLNPSNYQGYFQGMPHILYNYIKCNVM